MKKLGHLAYTVAIAAVALTATFAAPAQADDCVVLQRSVLRSSSAVGPGVTEYSYSEPSYVVERRVLSEEPVASTRIISTKSYMPASSFLRVDEPQTMIIQKSVVVERPQLTIMKPAVITSPVILERSSTITSPVILERPSVVTSSVVVDPPVVMERRINDPVVIRRERIIERGDSKHLLDARMPFVKLKVF